MVKYNTSKTNGMDKKCRHKETGKEGIIKREMKGTKDFPDQYGIFWTLRYYIIYNFYK